MNQLEILNYYKKVQDKIIEFAKDREVVGSFRDGSFCKRPDTLLYPKDIIQNVKQGVIAFHCSVEKWSQPMRLSVDLGQEELNNLRKGFDLIIDIDSKLKLEHAKIAANAVCNYLKDLGINASVKFSGSRGFHLGISNEAFPRKIDFKPIQEQYPQVPQALANFIREQVKDQILDELIAFEGGVAALVRLVPSISELTPYAFVDIEKNWGSRHLFRMPYSLHPKKWLASVPVKNIKNFSLDLAKPENVKTDVDFLINKKDEATELLLKALDWKAKMTKPKRKPERIIRFKRPIPEEYFPVCIKQILNGLDDGRKRSLFTLIAFLRSVNWKDEDIEKRIKEWNNKNSRPLADRMVNTQLKWHLRQSRKLMPANSDSDLFYKSIGIRHDAECGKNPVNDAFRIYRKKR